MVILSDIQSNKWIFNQYTFHYLFVFIFRCILWSVHDWSWLLHAEVWAVEDWWHQTQCHMVSSCKPLYLHGCLNNWILGCAMGHDWRAIPNQSRFTPEFWTITNTLIYFVSCSTNRHLKFKNKSIKTSIPSQCFKIILDATTITTMEKFIELNNNKYHLRWNWQKLLKLIHFDCPFT